MDIRSIEFPKDFSRSRHVKFISVTLFEKEFPVVLLLMRVRIERGTMEIHRTRIRLSDNALLEGVVGHKHNLAVVQKKIPKIRELIAKHQTAP